MREAGVETGKVNMFSFEQYRIHRLKLVYEQNNLTIDQTEISSHITPIEASKKDLETTMNIQSQDLL